jgi:hypothetical protein
MIDRTCLEISSPRLGPNFPLLIWLEGILLPMCSQGKAQAIREHDNPPRNSKINAYVVPIAS